MRSKESDKQKAASLLQEDIMKSPLHCFGSYNECKPEYCKVVQSLKEKIILTGQIQSLIQMILRAHPLRFQAVLLLQHQTW